MIRDELPELAKVMDDISKIYHSVDEPDGFAFMQELQRPDSNAARAMARVELLTEQCKLMIEAHSISDESKARFTSSISADISNISLLGAEISIILVLAPGLHPSTDWFHRKVFGEGDALDTSIYYVVIHPELLKEAQNRWAANPRLKYTKFDDNRMADIADKRSAENTLLEEHGIPDDRSNWQWALEAINAAQAGLRHLNLNFRLCDFVEWTCTDQPPNIYQGATFGEPSLFAQRAFGSRIQSDDTLLRLEGGAIWKSEKDTYISPLWEYLSWSSGSRAGDVARYLGHIGEGIDTALVSLDPNCDSYDARLVRSAHTRIFRAGEAMIRLRVKLELGETVLKGKRADVATRYRAVQGGAKSSEARNNRISSLLTHMEKLVNESPAITRIGPDALAALARDDAMMNMPSLWTQGANQVSEYLGELRRGEARADLQARYLALFPQKPLKQFLDRNARA